MHKVFPLSLILNHNKLFNFLYIADTHIIPKQIILPDYSLYGKQAPIVRNKLMVDLADSVLVIWDGKSHGAKITADYAKKLNKLLNNIII